MGSLLVTSGPNVGRRFTLLERMRVGRAADNEIVLNDHLVSRYHAEITHEDGRFMLRDLGSKNGILVNGLPATEHGLHDGDRVQIGESAFAYEAPQQFHSARFSDVSICLDLDTDAGVRILTREPAPAPAPGPMELLSYLGRLLESDAEALPEMLNAVLRHLLEIFGASAGSLMLRTSTGEATPLVAVAPAGEESLTLPREAVRRALAGPDPVLAAFESAGDPKMGAGGGDIARRRTRKALLVPLVQQGRIFGALHLERPDGIEFEPEEMSQIQTVARLVAGIVRQAIQRDQLVLAAPEWPSEPFIGASPGAKSIREQIRKYAASDATVLLTGETGTGKELVAHAIHGTSARAAAPMVAIDCSSIPANLMESELFGHEAGAFTGADRMKRGKIEMAEGGTLFLDEIGEMIPDLQPKLLRFLESLNYYRVGGVRPIPADVRVIAATNRNLDEAVKEGRFREDLLYRLKVMPLHLPPLRDRPEDIRPLVEYFIPRLASKLGKPFLGLLDEAWNLLEHYPWPGNVRELRHGLERALILSDDGYLRADHFQLTLPEAPVEPSTMGGHQDELDQTRPALGLRSAAPPPLAQVEAEAIRRALRYAGGNRQHAARILQIHRNTLAKKIQEYEIEI